jgi:hypothetical protein
VHMLEVIECLKLVVRNVQRCYVLKPLAALLAKLLDAVVGQIKDL